MKVDPTGFRELGMPESLVHYAEQADFPEAYAWASGLFALGVVVACSGAAIGSFLVAVALVDGLRDAHHIEGTWLVVQEMGPSGVLGLFT
ncbi:MAG: hypothetical protein AAF211_20660, partial [Myxococcota bacterium]